MIRTSWREGVVHRTYQLTESGCAGYVAGTGKFPEIWNRLYSRLYYEVFDWRPGVSLGDMLFSKCRGFAWHPVGVAPTSRFKTLFTAHISFSRHHLWVVSFLLRTMRILVFGLAFFMAYSPLRALLSIHHIYPRRQYSGLPDIHPSTCPNDNLMRHVAEWIAR